MALCLISPYLLALWIYTKPFSTGLPMLECLASRYKLSMCSNSSFSFSIWVFLSVIFLLRSYASITEAESRGLRCYFSDHSSLPRQRLGQISSCQKTPHCGINHPKFKFLKSNDAYLCGNPITHHFVRTVNSMTREMFLELFFLLLTTLVLLLKPSYFQAIIRLVQIMIESVNHK